MAKHEKLFWHKCQIGVAFNAIFLSEKKLNLVRITEINGRLWLCWSNWLIVILSYVYLALTVILYSSRWLVVVVHEIKNNKKSHIAAFFTKSFPFFLSFFAIFNLWPCGSKQTFATLIKFQSEIVDLHYELPKPRMKMVILHAVKGTLMQIWKSPYMFLFI